jgi:hypothetical protein
LSYWLAVAVKRLQDSINKHVVCSACGTAPGSAGALALQTALLRVPLSSAGAMHRVFNVSAAPCNCLQDEIITPPIPHSWSMWYMGYGPEKDMQRSIDVVNYNITYFMGTALPNQACPLAAWNAYWTLRTHGIPTVR